MGNSANLLQESLVAALRTEPLLIRAEEFIHSARSRGEQNQLENNLARLLDPELPSAQTDQRLYRGMDSGLIDKFRAAMEIAVTGGANLADAEKRILESFGLTKVGELTTTMQSRLKGPAELDDRDLAIYVPLDDPDKEEFYRALKRDLQEVQVAPDELATGSDAGEPEVAPAIGPESKFALAISPEATPPLAISLAATPAPAISPKPEPEPAEPATDLAPDLATDLRPAQVLVVSAGSAAGQLTKLNPVPMLTAALEAAGLGGDGFGFVLRYGRYAPQGRKSEFLVGGLGLADLSKRLGNWLEAQGPLDGQVQVIDEGSGELTIYLLLAEAA